MSIQTLEIDERYLGYCLKVELEQTFESPDVLKALRFPRKPPFSSKQPSPLQLPGQENQVVINRLFGGLPSLVRFLWEWEVSILGLLACYHLKLEE